MPQTERDALKMAVQATANLIARRQPKASVSEDVDAALEQAQRRQDP